MTIAKESTVDLQEKYEKVKKLVEENSKSDPETEPFLSKYSARQILIGMKANIENLLHSQTPDSKEYIKLTGMLGAVLLNLGTISIDTEELSMSEKHLNKCQDVVKKYELEPDIILVTLGMLNQFGILWSLRDPEKSKIHLEKAEVLYKDCQNSNIIPVDIHDLFRANVESYNVDLATQNLEKLHTLTLYYLAQIYGSLHDGLKSAVYCHNTLKRQLESDDYELIDWALNSATLSQYFMEKNGFKQARHHLAASSYMLEICENKINESTSQSEEHDAKVENFKHRSADVARCWAKYGLLLLSNSRDRLLHHSDDIDTDCTLSSDLAKLELSEDSSVSKDDLAHLEFLTLNVAAYESQVTDQFVLVFDDAKRVFLNAQTWLGKAQSYYTLNKLASDYIEIVQDQSQLYFHLTFFEENPENQAKMHKRRIDLLETVVKEVSPVYYVQYCRQIWYELAQAYGDILDIKMDKLQESDERPSPHLLSKINVLVDKSIQHYRSFSNSFKDVVTQEMPKAIDKQMAKPFLLSYFHVGALCSRYITQDKRVSLKHIEESLVAYKTVIDYFEANPDCEVSIPNEKAICVEMVTLLPLKIIKMKEEITWQLGENLMLMHNVYALNRKR